MITDVERVYSSSQGDPAFAEVLDALASRSDASLAEAIEADGRLRLQHGKAVTLERYLSALADLATFTDALDAAIDVSLRSLSGSARITTQAIESLIAQHPAMERQIREAATLNAAVWSTNDVRSCVERPPLKPLPCDFGPHLASGERRYQLQRLLGQGSFGQVYKAHDRQMSDAGHPAVVAIKILVAERSSLSRQRQLDEATKARRISHPNVVQVIDRGTSDEDEDFIVYEYVDGGDLSDLRATRLPMAPRDAAALIAKAARGVHAAHNAGLIHCDIKPANIMLTSDGEPKVADFGIAVRLDERSNDKPSYRNAGGPVGNIAFISPEQFRGDVDGFSVSSDVYALGGILFQLITARLPNGSSWSEIAATHDDHTGRSVAPSPRSVRTEVDHDLDAICRRALAPSPADRPGSAAALADDLQGWLGREPLAWMRPSLGRRLTLWARRKPALAAATAAIIVVAIAGALVALHFSSLATKRKNDAALAQMNADEEQRKSAIRAEYGNKLIKGLSNLQGEQRERFITDTMMQVWVYEYLYGPSLLGSPETVAEIWRRRMESVRQFIAQRQARGLGDALETLQWEVMLGFWLVSEGDHAEAIPLLTRGLERWRSMLPEEDPWLADIQTMLLCADVNRWSDAPLAAPEQELARVDALKNLESRLVAAAGALDELRPRSPMHFLVVRRLIDLQGPNLLNSPGRQTELRDIYHALIEETQMQTSGAAAEARRVNEAVEKSQPLQK